MEFQLILVLCIDLHPESCLVFYSDVRLFGLANISTLLSCHCHHKRNIFENFVDIFTVCMDICQRYLYHFHNPSVSCQLNFRLSVSSEVSTVNSHLSVSSEVSTDT